MGDEANLTPHPRPLSRKGRGESQRAARLALISFACFFLLLQAMLILLGERFFPDRLDLEYRVRIKSIKTLAAKYPDRPVMIFLGTSRTISALNAKQATQATNALVINLGMTGHTPALLWMVAERLLEDHVPCDYLFVEALPGHFSKAIDVSSIPLFIGEERLASRDIRRMADLDPALQSLHPHRIPWFFCWSWENRNSLQHWWFPKWNQPLRTMNPGRFSFDEYGYFPASPPLDDEVTMNRLLTATESQYRPLLQQYQIDPQPREALRRIIKRCEKAQIPLVLYSMPEDRTFHSWYAADANEQFRSMVNDCRGASTQPIEWYDTREWLSDDQFFDRHHVLPTGSAQFTQRVIQEWVIPRLK
jgi:hypothetical protein